MPVWCVLRVDLDGLKLSETTAFDPVRARQVFEAECLRLGAGDGAAVYLRCDGVVVDQVVGRPVQQLQDELVCSVPDNGAEGGLSDEQ